MCDIRVIETIMSSDSPAMKQNWGILLKEAS